ncbi:3-deoxy-D-manno-octulosonic acid transferase [Muribaculaceae bacterium Isolate-042 (Harlan)]|jgi:3-deoxy-D-manno-octulosonic-acid transferase|uniref:3-deoxy-D-manno-octulosonic acid transferase n=1 Tax=Muribaculum intestinale TaxID=1796646 RepID=A0A4V3RUJ3_9BACT|nr:glycosyltransferase N-terminal domain-containing protein [Muribaculum intestinale]MCX4368629.1 3-deoxy-D-manno-octulosonic acid transferase [Duncaniella sp.]ROS80457.1 3-deoxy-D-manno-octulosonic acid transferase [Muribaculaceae bacterium Isolate-042 (Harlan)]MYM11651.1 3-deoxy-D-manno-octulosonic acid transferase [Muribaculum intestinale]TGX87122.1 3-deoxy-D-manno-octulosonic acid transferase [Muribaculum intestinale]TGY75109.1 3-deoxy-D-manno-octulosonic acid transferase [Muribaculum inte
MNLLYNAGISLYGLGMRIAALRSDKVRRLLKGQREALPYLRHTIDSDHGYIWIHAASLGEFEQGRPFIEMVRRLHPQAKILLTFFSPSGYEVRCNFPLVDAVSYLPLDSPHNVKAFLDAVKPRMALFIKYEFWGNYLQELRRRGIPTYIISSIFRKSQIFFKPWGGMFRSMLRCYTHIFVQDDNSMRLLSDIGVYNVSVAGDTRFDRVTDIMRERPDVPQAEAISEDSPCLTIVAGSTWPPDEELLLPYVNSHPEVRLIIAPHEVRTDRIEDIVSKLSRPVVCLSKATPEQAAKADCLIVDCYGKLSGVYRYGDIAYIGGGFGAGIHNINEAAVYDMPVLFGPHYRKFKEASDMIECGGAFTFSDKAGFISAIDPLVSDSEYLHEAGRAAGHYIREHLGATQRVYTALSSIIESIN